MLAEGAIPSARAGVFTCGSSETPDAAGAAVCDCCCSCAFAKGMEGLCGRELTVRDIIKYKGSKDGKRWYLSTNDWYFVPEMFEEVYPVQAQVNPPFPRITLDNPGQLSAHCTEMGKDILEKYPDVSAKIKEAGKRLAAYTVAKGLSAKPKLKQVKTTRLMKITKL